MKPGIAMCQVKIGAPTAGIKNPMKPIIPAAMEDWDDGRPTIECIQPKRNPHLGPRPRRK